MEPHLPIRVFISYTWESESHSARVLGLARRLRQEGVDAWLDQYDPHPRFGWRHWMKSEIDKARFVLLVCTAEYRKRFESPILMTGVGWEGSIISEDLIKNAGDNVKYLPVVFERAYREYVPAMLMRYTFEDIGTSAGYDELYRHLTNQPKYPPP